MWMQESLRFAGKVFNAKAPRVLDLAALNLKRGRELGVPGYLGAQRIYYTGKGSENIEPSFRSSLLKLRVSQKDRRFRRWAL